MTLRQLGFSMTTATQTQVVLQDVERGRLVTIPRHCVLSETELLLVLLAARVPTCDFVAQLARGSGEMPRVDLALSGSSRSWNNREPTI
jgi:hypothetical protein